MIRRAVLYLMALVVLTAGILPGQKHVRVAVIGDVHGHLTPERKGPIIRYIKKLGVDAVVNAGDCSFRRNSSGADSADSWRDQLFPIPVYSTPGNHDQGLLASPTAQDTLAPESFFCDYNKQASPFGYHFVDIGTSRWVLGNALLNIPTEACTTNGRTLLPSAVEMTAPIMGNASRGFAHPDSEQYRWTKAAFQSKPGTFAFYVTHFPAVNWQGTTNNGDAAWGQYRAGVSATNFGDMIEDNGCAVWFGGHQHTQGARLFPTRNDTLTTRTPGDSTLVHCLVPAVNTSHASGAAPDTCLGCLGAYRALNKLPGEFVAKYRPGNAAPDTLPLTLVVDIQDKFMRVTEVDTSGFIYDEWTVDRR